MQDDLQKRKTDQSTTWLCSVISLLRSRKKSILQTGLGDIFSGSGSLVLGEVVSPFTRKIKGHQVGQK